MRLLHVPATCLALAVAGSPAPAEDPAPPAAAAPLTARQVVDRIRKNVGCAWSDRTVDTIKAGDPDTPVTGLATTRWTSSGAPPPRGRT